MRGRQENSDITLHVGIFEAQACLVSKKSVCGVMFLSDRKAEERHVRHCRARASAAPRYTEGNCEVSPICRIHLPTFRS